MAKKHKTKKKGGKRYKCPKCSKTFKSYTGRYKHIKKKHKRK